jgi:hypothetical protein
MQQTYFLSNNPEINNLVQEFSIQDMPPGKK